MHQEDAPPPTFSEWLNTMSRMSGYGSTTALAQAIGVSQSTVSRWKTRNARPGIDHLVKLSKLFKMDLKALLVIAEYIDAKAADTTKGDYYPAGHQGRSPIDIGVLSELDDDQSDAIYQFWGRRQQEERNRMQEVLEMARAVQQFGADPAVLRRHWPKIIASELSKHVSDCMFGVLSAAPLNVMVPYSEGVYDSEISLFRSRFAVNQDAPLGLVASVRTGRDRTGSWRFELRDSRGHILAWSEEFEHPDAAIEASRAWLSRNQHVFEDGMGYF